MSNARTNGILGLLAGVAVGTTLGILFAPASGKKTRARIRKRVSNAKEEFGDVIERAHEEWSKAKGKATDAASMTKEEVTDFIHFLFEEGKDLKERLKKDLDETVDETEAKAKAAADRVKHSAN